MSESAFPDQDGRFSDRLIVSSDFARDFARMRGEGWRVDEIYPADEPHSAILSRAGESAHLSSMPDAGEPSDRLPAFQAEFILTRSAADGGEGRAGMRYRDLIPSRLGGRYIASHITIAEGGPVDDWVHYHGVAFQMIFVRSGWVRVVYEDQGEPFVMHAGEMVLQPPYIRHRVLESSPGLEVIEIGCPALHKTFSDHEMQLPNGIGQDRTFSGQHFLHSAIDDRDAGLMDATGGLADARIVSAATRFEPHVGELVFGFVLEGAARLDFGDGAALGPADAFVIQPGEAWAIADASADFRLLHVTTAQMPERIPGSPAKSA
ncbi:cupin domain-containing protein [Sphingomonas alba]|uniref:Cupin type-2 domain-containing protein n=1 Tax=Sphingomonas alba TaxID=2908208 RepID=A0ABT0RJ10_9SPHN|nr:cupin domain-containing protein [Sphingomonas alba]MCL6682624.1 hypothetical protein [Sphingomonas alba]